MANKNTVAAIKKKLNDYLETERAIEIQKERIDRLDMKITSVGGAKISDMPRPASPSFDRTTKLIDRKVDLEKELEDLIKSHDKEEKEITALAHKLDDADERSVILLRYIDCMAWADVTDTLYGGEKDFLDKLDTYTRRTYRVHGEALTKLAEFC